MTRRLSDVHIVSQELLPTPREIKQQLPLDAEREEFVGSSRASIERILDGEDRRRFVVVGPCSIHDTETALEYAHRLRGLAEEVRETMLLVMRVYFSKPRTTVGWKGFINDPYLDDSFRIDEGLKKARELLLALADMRLPAGTEALDPIIPQYLDDLISWNAIGARTTESQTHREMASGLSTPVGFKNATDGNMQVAVNAMQSVSGPHHFLGINQDGQVTVLRTSGNPYSHIVLRGGDRPNYDSVCVAICEKLLRQHSLPPNIMIDCSHGNSFKDPDLQPLVLDNCINQILEGNRSIVGLMLESNLHAGNQKIGPDPTKLAYGVSVTDACIDWEATERAIRKAHRNLLKSVE
ncbi:MAG: 3-deoxy-7-phosphoheptulonate synthase [Planctomycetes bacterium]|nr:3-deoxy-7-phosphoheptulonate synthase [Planctomycetota bacterium]